MFCSALSLGRSLQAGLDGRSYLSACQSAWGGRESSAAPNPDVPREYAHFHFEYRPPF